MKDYYKLLDLKTSAGPEEIKAAFDKLDGQFNPAKNNGDTTFQTTYFEIKKAYEVLFHEESRRQYDKSINVNQPKAKIKYFKTNRDSFEDGDTIKIEWATENTVKVEIDLFGEVDLSGAKVFKPRNSKNDLKIEIKAWKADAETPVNQLLTIPFIQELDMGGPDADLKREKISSPEEIKPEVKEVLPADHDIKKPELKPGNIETNFDGEEWIEEKFFSATGRIRRSTYLVRALLLAIPAFILYYFIYESTLYYVDYSAILIFSILGLIAIAVLNMMQFIKRLHDIGLSGWFALFSLVPYLGGFFGLVIMCIDGNKGANQYGPDPKSPPREVNTQT